MEAYSIFRLKHKIPIGNRAVKHASKQIIAGLIESTPPSRSAGVRLIATKSTEKMRHVCVSHGLGREPAPRQKRGQYPQPDVGENPGPMANADRTGDRLEPASIGLGDFAVPVLLANIRAVDGLAVMS